MQALVKTARGAGHLELRQIPIPQLTPDEVLMPERLPRWAATWRVGLPVTVWCPNSTPTLVGAAANASPIKVILEP